MISTEVYGFTGQGATLKAAREDAQKQAAIAMRGTYTPRVLQYRGETAILSRTPQGWGYRFLQLVEGKAAHASHCTSLPNDTDETDAYRGMVRHLAQCTMKLDDDQPPPFLTDDKDRREWTDYRNWQRRYREHKAAGMNDTEAHAAACAGGAA
jgi:hypothetical protein